MPDDVVLTANLRTERGSGPAGRSRVEGAVPAVVYGLGGDTVTITVPARELNHILAHGANTMITLRLDGDDQFALARQVQRHPTRGSLVHVDFVRVRTDVAISADVTINLNGEPEGVKSGGLLEQLIFSLPIEAMPQSIPTSIDLDVSDLAIGDQLHVRDLPLPHGVTATVDDDALVAQIAAPRVGTGPGGVGEAGEAEAAAGGEEAAEADAESGEE